MEGVKQMDMANVTDVDCQSTTSTRSMLKLPMQEMMMNDLETMRPMPDFCEGGHCAAEQAPPMQRDVTDVPVEEIRPCGGCCCGISGCFCGCPSCIGCVGQCTLLCCLCKFVNCKMLDCKDEDSRCCACYNCSQYLAFPNKLLECQEQVCCLDVRCAFPCTKKVPCVFGTLGLICCADWKWVGCKFMPRLGDIIPRLDERVGKSPTAASG